MAMASQWVMFRYRPNAALLACHRPRGDVQIGVLYGLTLRPFGVVSAQASDASLRPAMVAYVQGFPHELANPEVGTRSIDQKIGRSFAKST